MTEPVSQPGWIARTFTRARVFGTRLARIPFADRTVELPFVLTRTQLSALVTGGVLAMVAYGLGAVLGIAAWTTWPVVIVTLLMVFALGLSSAPDRGAGLMLEGYLRMLWASLPFTSSVSSSRRRPGRSRERIVVRMQLHAAPRHGEGR